jgi:hypothetical protein
VGVAGGDDHGGVLRERGQQQAEEEVVREVVDGEGGLEPVLGAGPGGGELYARVEHEHVDRCGAEGVGHGPREPPDARQAAEVERQPFARAGSVAGGAGAE